MAYRTGLDGQSSYRLKLQRGLKETSFVAESTQSMVQRLTLHNEICERVAGLTPSPVAAHILEILRNERAPAQKLAEVIATDPLLAVRVLKLADLAAGRSQELIGVSHAITAMGVDAIESLALGLTTFPLQSVSGEQDGSDFDHGPITLRDLWEHSIGCATIAARIATHVDHVSPNQAFAAGFLHDVGRLLMYRCSREGFYTATTVATAKSIHSLRLRRWLWE